MRRRLFVVGLATTLLIVIALVVPLGLLVKRQAADRARVSTERAVQSASALVALALTVDAGPEAMESVADGLEPGIIIVVDDGTVLGQPLAGQGTLIEAAYTGATITALVDGGWEIALPVIGDGTVVVVDGFATDSELTEGVWGAWSLLATLGVVMVGLAVWVVDRLGRRMVEPMRELAGAAHLMSEGDLEARVAGDTLSDVPKEIVEVGQAFNTLAAKLDLLLVAEREAVADLSHRLRTPLTSLRLRAEGIADPTDRLETLAQVDRLEEAIDRIIEASRSRPASSRVSCHLDTVAADRSAFWRVLAEEEGRDFAVELGAGAAELGVPAEEVGVLIDTLIGNVFAHTPAGTSFRLKTGEQDNLPWIELSDEGPGFHSSDLVDRGVSGRGSTGLGLDIVRRTAETTGGRIELVDGDNGGATVRVWFG